VVVGTRRTPLYLLIVHRDHPKLFKPLENTLGGIPRFLRGDGADGWQAPLDWPVLVLMLLQRDFEEGPACA
jgi:hypothetical protein